jgi:CheY-like chemotaxis protein
MSLLHTGDVRQLKLLSVGTNLTLLGFRNLVLENAGYEVASAKTAALALQAIKSQPLNALIVGHSLSPRLKEVVVVAATERGMPAIVLYVSDFESRIPGARAHLCGMDGAATILDVLSDVFSGADPRSEN